MATVALGAGACGSVAGQPEPTTAPPSVSDGSGGSQDASPSSTSGVANVDACSLLTANEASGLGLPAAGEKLNAGAKSGCQWDGSDYSVGVAVRTDVGLAGVQSNGGTITTTSVGHHHQAVRLQDDGGCTYVLGISELSRVDVGATGNTRGSGECQEALSAARFVEKKLPSS
jgi:hypothetical protein